jgi:hypothetical protein
LRADAERVLVDAHVHLYPCFPLEAFLDAARANLRRLSPGPAAGVLMFTETASDDAFGDLVRGAGRHVAGHWRVTPTEEGAALTATERGGDQLVLVAGRQIQTREGLEVLALGTLRRPPERADFADALRDVLDAGEIAVVPWGFGKWTFARGREVARALTEIESPRLYLGDNGGRPRGAPEPALFRAAAARGVRVLPGTDPLPFPAQVRRVASYVSEIPGPLDPAKPAASLIRRLSDPSTRPAPLGARRGPPAFLIDQLRMQAHKHLRSGRR